MTQTYTEDRPLESMAVLTAGDGDGLRTIRIAPDGETKSKRGTFVIDAEAA